jgi:hypothetical protein
MKPVINLLLKMTLIYVDQKLGNNVFQATVSWEHAGWEDPDFYGWRIYYAIRPEEPLRQLGEDVIYAQGTSPEHYAQHIVGAGGVKTTCRLAVTSVSPPGLKESEHSNEIPVIMDFRDSTSPVILRVTIVPRP